MCGQELTGIRVVLQPQPGVEGCFAKLEHAAVMRHEDTQVGAFGHPERLFRSDSILSS